MNWIAQQPYYKIERRMSRTEQEMIVHERMLYLFTDKVVTHSRQFSLLDVFDVSYRLIGDQEGLLYLHTRIGVFSYQLKSDPRTFMDTYRKLVTEG